jgi:hypothetical protein
VKTRIAQEMKFLDAVMSSSEDVTDKEFNSIREAHDSLAGARDLIENVLLHTKWKP